MFCPADLGGVLGSEVMLRPVPGYSHVSVSFVFCGFALKVLCRWALGGSVFAVLRCWFSRSTVADRSSDDGTYVVSAVLGATSVSTDSLVYGRFQFSIYFS